MKVSNLDNINSGHILKLEVRGEPRLPDQFQRLLDQLLEPLVVITGDGLHEEKRDVHFCLLHAQRGEAKRRLDQFLEVVPGIGC